MAGAGEKTSPDGIREELDRRFLAAMRARDGRTADVIRAVRARVTEEQKKQGGSSATGDALYLPVIERYVKQLEKALPDFEKAGEAGAPTVERYRFEIDLLSEFLPKKLGEAETRALVSETIAALGVTDPRQLGRVMGALMKEHKDVLDAQLARRCIEEALSG